MEIGKAKFKYCVEPILKTQCQNMQFFFFFFLVQVEVNIVELNPVGIGGSIFRAINIIIYILHDKKTYTQMTSHVVMNTNNYEHV